MSRTATEDERHDDARRANATTARPGGTPMFVPIAGGAGRLFAGAARTVTLAVPDGGGVFRRRDARRGRLPGLGERGGVDAAGRNESPAPDARHGRPVCSARAQIGVETRAANWEAGHPDPHRASYVEDDATAGAAPMTVRCNG